MTQDSNDPIDISPDYQEEEFVPPSFPAGIGHPPESLFGQRVKLVREHYKLNIEAMSRLTKIVDVHDDGRGISPPAIARYESGESLPGARELRLLCDALDISPSWLLYGFVEDNSPPPEERALLDAMRYFVYKQRDEARIFDLPSPKEIAAKRRMARAERLAKARKPAQK